MASSIEAAQAPVGVEQHQEALLLQKYGRLAPKKHLLMQRRNSGRQHFDSADWALSKDAAAQGLQSPLAAEQLPARLAPPTTPLIARRPSNLAASE